MVVVVALDTDLPFWYTVRTIKEREKGMTETKHPWSRVSNTWKTFYGAKMPKSKEMENTLEGFSSVLFGTSRKESLENSICVICKGEAKEFHDPLSEYEFGISGMCQECQDNVFRKSTSSNSV